MRRHQRLLPPSFLPPGGRHRRLLFLHSSLIASDLSGLATSPVRYPSPSTSRPHRLPLSLFHHLLFLLYPSRSPSAHSSAPSFSPVSLRSQLDTAARQRQTCTARRRRSAQIYNSTVEDNLFPSPISRIVTSRRLRSPEPPVASLLAIADLTLSLDTPSLSNSFFSHSHSLSLFAADADAAAEDNPSLAKDSPPPSSLSQRR